MGTSPDTPTLLSCVCFPTSFVGFSEDAFKTSLAQSLFLGEPILQHLPRKTSNLSPQVALVICNSFVPITLALNHSWGHFRVPSPIRSLPSGALGGLLSEVESFLHILISTNPETN